MDGEGDYGFRSSQETFFKLSILSYALRAKNIGSRRRKLMEFFNFVFAQEKANSQLHCFFFYIFCFFVWHQS